MKYIKPFIINEEWSKNDPIPELNKKSKLGIILLGAPGVGKSTFVKNFIHPRNFNIKTFSTDDVSLMFTKDPNAYHKGSSELNLNRLRGFMKSGQSFIYDTTGTQEENIINITQKARENGYDVIFIHIIAPLDVSIKQNLGRDRQVPEDYIKMAYDKQFGNMSKYSQLGKYYIVQNRDDKYKINIYELGRIRKKYKHLMESSHSINDLDIEMIIHILDDITEEFNNVVLYDHDNKVYYPNQFSEEKQKNFKISKEIYNVRQNRFKVSVELNSTDYTVFSKLIGMFKVCIDRFSDFGWKMLDISVNCSSTVGTDAVFQRVTYVFSKAEERVNGEFNEKEMTDSLHVYFNDYGLSISNIDFSVNSDDEYEARVEFESLRFQGEMPDNMSEILSEIERLIGASDCNIMRSGVAVFAWANW